MESYKICFIRCYYTVYILLMDYWHKGMETKSMPKKYYTSSKQWLEANLSILLQA